MGLFKHKRKDKKADVDDAVVTYHITAALNGKLTVTPTPSSYHAYSITLSRPKSFQDTIDVAVHRSAASTAATPDVVGHCLIQVALGRFLECRLGDGTAVKLRREGHGTKPATYTLETADGAHRGYRWARDEGAIGVPTTASRRLQLVDGEGNVVARFAGASAGVSEFGVLEVYSGRAAEDTDWCGLLVLTAVCVYAREERNRERSEKRSNVVGWIGNWGGLLTMGIPAGG
jgi:hypothetical protein